LFFEIDIPIHVPTGKIDLSKWKSKGQQPGEELMPDTDILEGKKLTFFLF